MRRTDSFKNTLMLGKIEAGGEGDDRGWDGWLASPTRRTWIWANSESWWWTGKSGVLQSMGLQRVGHDWATELNWLSSWKETWTLISICYKPWIHLPSYISSYEKRSWYFWRQLWLNILILSPKHPNQYNRWLLQSQLWEAQERNNDGEPLAYMCLPTFLIFIEDKHCLCIIETSQKISRKQHFNS